MLLVFCWLLLSVCVTLVGKLGKSEPIIGIGAVMLLMTAMVCNVS